MRTVYKYVPIKAQLIIAVVFWLAVIGLILAGSTTAVLMLLGLIVSNAILLSVLNYIGKQNAEIRALKSQIEKLKLENKKLMHPLYGND